MHLRRAVLLFAIVLLLSAVAASISPRSRQTQSPTGTTVAPTVQAPLGEPRPLQAVTMRVPTHRGRPAVRVTREGHVALYVASATPGEVTIENRGLAQAAEPGTPATFDLFVTSGGRYAVMFTPADGTMPIPVGVIVVRS